MAYIKKYLNKICNVFTLIEMLVVVAIIAVLISILLPALNKAKGLGKRIACVNNMKQIYSAASFYLNDHDEYLPGGTYYNTLIKLIPEYIGQGNKRWSGGGYYVSENLSGPLICPATWKGDRSPSWDSSKIWCDRYFPNYCTTVVIYIADDITYRRWGGWRKACFHSDWSKYEGDDDAKKISQVMDNTIILTEKGFYRSSWSVVMPYNQVNRPKDGNSSTFSSYTPAWWRHGKAANFLFKAGNVQTYKFGSVLFKTSEEYGWQVE